jgi:hypothetical protein
MQGNTSRIVPGILICLAMLALSSGLQAQSDLWKSY